MRVNFGYDKGVQSVEIPDKNLIGILSANEIQYDRTGTEAVRFALSHPIGQPRLSKNVRPGMKIAVVTSDISRPLPGREVIPAILDELFLSGVSPEDVTVVFALGSHRPHTEDEKRFLVGDRVFETVRCVDSDPNDCVRLGVTKRGTPVDITRSVAEADYKIAVGNVEFHYFAGYSGGSKALMPGVSTVEAIRANHRMMTDENALAGKLTGNPIREDIEEAGEIAGLDSIVNVVLDEHKRIVFAVSGDKIKAHRVACAFLDQMYRVPIRKKADIVLVSQGGAPKDANLYQTQKALENAKYAVKPGGTIILIGSCKEGLGSRTFEAWLKEAASPEDLIKRVREQFELGGHKAAAIALVLRSARVILVSDLDPELVKRIFLIPAGSAAEAFDEALSIAGPDASVIAMPFGGATLPVIQNG
ncbi:MAG: nickel-dependent lactate racemase [Lachnospiraceae bacterium]|nr:nickel-dependent lactate racemase [Lachnospiraceae bacterium]